MATTAERLAGALAEAARTRAERDERFGDAIPIYRFRTEPVTVTRPEQ